ncbi:MAG TPA: phosphate acetyltransferase [Gaiellaceae bacterium]|nr:phosphate acetyltransferase [Gaiellaceae bacterium]
MARKLYVTAMEPQSGKSVVALGLMELLSARVERLGFFRPIVPSADEPDAQIELIRRRYQLAAPYEQMHALSQDEAAAIPAYEELRKRVVEAYKQLEQGCDFVLCEGTDFTSATSALDYGLNADLANELGAPVLVVVKGGTTEETVASVRAARNSLAHKGCTIFGVVVNRVPPERVEELSRTLGAQDGSEPVYVLPELPELAFPTVGEIADELGAEILSDSTEEALQRDVRDVRVAAMSVEHFIDDLVDGTLVVVPGDRPDILVASLASTVSPAIPTVAGVLVTGGYPLSETVRRLLESAPFPVLNAEQPLHVAANVVQSVRPVIRAENERKIATALGVFESAVDTAELGQRIALERPPRMTPIMFEYELIERAKADRKHIVLPEGDDERVLRAAEILLRRGVVDLTILGDPKDVAARASAAGVDLGGALVVDPLLSPLRQEYANRYHELRKSRGMTEELALDVVAAPTYFGTMLVAHGAVDGMVSGAVHTTADTIRPAFEIIKSRAGVSVVSSVFFMCLADGVLVYGDCAVNPQPDVAQLADIAISSAETARTFGIEPRIAMLSYATGTSGKGPNVTIVREATEAVRERRPDLLVEGPIQYDAAVDAGVAALKMPESDVAGRATVFIFPDLEAGNVAYKAVQRAANAVAIGPVLQGLRKPVNDLSRGCSVTDIVNTVAITAIQAQENST